MLILGHRGTGVTMRNTNAQEDARRKAGASGPENTLKAFELALRGGADGIEFDVIRTADGDLAVIHDNKLRHHVRGAQGFVADHTMDQLRRMDAGDGEPIPSLRDVFALAAQFNFPLLNIELAGPDSYGPAYRQARQSGYPLDRIVFSSFDHAQLARLRALDPAIKIGLLFRPRLPPASGIAWRKPAFSEKYVEGILPAVKPTSLHLVIEEVTPRAVAFARARGMEIFAWTRREAPPAPGSATASFVQRYGRAADIHLITDFPAAIRPALSGIG